MLPQEADDDVSLSQRYLDLLEQRVRERPELWLWLHDRWKRPKA